MLSIGKLGSTPWARESFHWELFLALDYLSKIFPSCNAMQRLYTVLHSLMSATTDLRPCRPTTSSVPPQSLDFQSEFNRLACLTGNVQEAGLGGGASARGVQRDGCSGQAAEQDQGIFCTGTRRLDCRYLRKLTLPLFIPCAPFHRHALGWTRPTIATVELSLFGRPAIDCYPLCHSTGIPRKTVLS